MTNTEIRKQLELAINDLGRFLNGLTGDFEYREKFRAGTLTAEEKQSFHETHIKGQHGRLSKEEFEQAADVHLRLGELYNGLREEDAA